MDVPLQVATALPPAPLRKGKEHKKNQPKMHIMALLSRLDVENNVCDSAQKESLSWNLKQVQAQHCGLHSAQHYGSWSVEQCLPTRELGGQGEAPEPWPRPAVPDSLTQGDSDKL